jgi:hypothetical protein
MIFFPYSKRENLEYFFFEERRLAVAFWVLKLPLMANEHLV